MLRKSMYVVAVGLLLMSSNLLADTLVVDNLKSGQSLEQPPRGAAKVQVSESLGKPVREIAAVGEPAISSWEYDGLVVYFENDKVIHSVAKR